MFKKILFQLHWLLGITAGLVLAVMGVTGALYSFQGEILTALNPTVLQVSAGDQTRLPLEQMIAQVEAATDARVQGLSLSEAPNDVARANMQPAAGERRGATVVFDPYTGQLLGEPAGAEFFMLMFKLHRWLAMGDVGKQLTGASTIALIFFCLSGLYLRWPRQAGNWRNWLTLNWRKTGRAFNWDLHAVAGTWVLLVYLLAALSGLYFSYDWYRAGATQLLSEHSAGQGPGGERRGPPGGERGGQAGQMRGERAMAPGQGRGVPPAETVRLSAEDYQRVEAALHAHAGSKLASWGLRLPGAAGQPVQVNYLLSDSPHPRAANMLAINPSNGEVKNHQRYADKPSGEQLLQSVYPLHTGEYFGLVGRLIMMIASLIMPLFFITGWLLYLNRRRNKRALRALRLNVESSNQTKPILLAFASQSGFAEQQAWRYAQQLRAAGTAADVCAVAELDAQRLAQYERALFVLSTFGDGEAPDSAKGFARNVLGQAAQLADLRYGVLALGDRHYAQFCGFATQVEAWLQRSGAKPLFATVQVDNGDAASLQSFAQALAQATGAQPVANSAEQWQAFTLADRQLLNPGSAGEAAYLLSLQVPENCQWQAGDILQVLPQNTPQAVTRFLAEQKMQAEQQVIVEGQSQTLAQVLRGRDLTTAPAGMAVNAQDMLEQLAPVAPRDYSIASIARDGYLQLIVRQQRHADGSLGLGSGWLTDGLQPGQTLAAMVRRNSSFHAPKSDCPLILIGNGTGLAGLRALLHERIEQGYPRNWLLFGERNRAHDYFCADELQAALNVGHLQHLDLAFSRDQGEKLYVQDVLRMQQSQLKLWLAKGAALYICGSEQGMAGGVDKTLREVLGNAQVQALIEQGRLRRDVY